MFNQSKKFTPMKKLALIAIAALTMLAACTKDDSKWIDGTLWKYRSQNSEGYKEECTLSLRNNGEVRYYRGFPPSYGYAYYDYWYVIKSYTYDGDKTGTIELRNVRGGHDCTAHFTLNYDQKKMSVGCTDFSCTLERIR